MAALFRKTSLGSDTTVDTISQDGSFRFDNPFISQPPLVQYPQLTLLPSFPYPKSSMKSIEVDSSVSLSFLLNAADILLVADGDSMRYISYYTSAIESLRLTTTNWNIDSDGLPPLTRGTELGKRAIIYYTGTKQSAIATALLDSLERCLEKGCNLFITGQDILEKNDTSVLIRDFFGIRFQANSTIGRTKGLAGDLFDGLGFLTIGADGANNQSSRDIIQIVDSTSTRATMGYGALGTGGVAGVRVDSNAGRGR